MPGCAAHNDDDENEIKVTGLATIASSDSANGSLGPQHGVTLDTVVKELRRGGFTLISSEQHTGRDIYVVMGKE